MKARHDPAQAISPVTWPEKLALAGHTLNDEIRWRKIRFGTGGRHKADGLSA
jgi:hypothetical protein